MRVLITGGTGFLGSFTAERRVAARDKVWVTRFDGSAGEHHETPGAKTISCDVTSREQVERAVLAANPDVIFHFAAQTFIGESWADPGYTFCTNSLGTLNLLEVVKSKSKEATVVIACSSAEYGEIAGRGAPVQESDSLLPVSPYGLSKLDQDILASLYGRTHGLRVIRARIFNTVGPRKQGDFLADFSQQIAAIEAGESEPVLRTGNLNSRRDLSDAHDTVAALDMLSRQGMPGEAYNVCSGRTVRIQEVVDLLLAAAGRRIEIQLQAPRLRPFEESIIWGDNRKLVACTGWSPVVALEQTVRDTLDYWREHPKEGGRKSESYSRPEAPNQSMPVRSKSAPQMH